MKLNLREVEFESTANPHGRRLNSPRNTTRNGMPVGLERACFSAYIPSTATAKDRWVSRCESSYLRHAFINSLKLHSNCFSRSISC